jgi:adenosine deaminase
MYHMVKMYQLVNGWRKVMDHMADFIATMPKAELHLHIEGTVAAAKVLELAERNGIDIPFSSEAELLAAQDYGQPALANFLKYHYMCTDVLRTGRDVYEITRDFLDRCVIENVPPRRTFLRSASSYQARHCL